jgi:hypothetical protein
MCVRPTPGAATSPVDACSRLENAFNRLDDFVAVQFGGNGGITLDAVKLLQESLGIQDAERGVIRDRVGALCADGHNATAASVLLGILIGISAREQAAANHSLI